MYYMYDYSQTLNHISFVCIWFYVKAIKRDHKEIDKQHEALMMELGKDPNVKMEDFLKAFKSPRVGRPDMAEKLGAKIKEDEKQKN